MRSSTRTGLVGRFGRKTLAASGAVLAVGLPLMFFAPAASAGGSQDPRATPSGGNVTTCAAVGFGSDTQMGSSSDSNASDSNVSGTVDGTGEYLQDVVITGSNVVIDAIVVKGGDNYNVYSDSTYLPPKLAVPQNYDSPPNGGGNIPTISHWFVCYNTNGTPLPLGTIGGGLGIAAITAIMLGVAQWRSRRRKRASAANMT